MIENLWYLFLSGVVLGSGPCFYFCAPILAAYTALYKPTFRGALISYLIFSLFKIIGYIVLGLICALFWKLLNNPWFMHTLDIIYMIMGLFIITIGISTLFHKTSLGAKCCATLHKGNIKNVGVLGFLVGISPCLPLLGILNYIVIISQMPMQSILFALVFGVGTVLSPLILIVGLSGKLATYTLGNKKLQLGMKIVGGLVLIFLGLQVTLGKLLQ
jgi:hypothetical protein